MKIYYSGLQWIYYKYTMVYTIVDKTYYRYTIMDYFSRILLIFLEFGKINICEKYRTDSFLRINLDKKL